MTKHITARRARDLFSYDADSGLFTWKKNGAAAFTSKTSKGYAVGNADKVKYYAHRVAWLMVYGEWPSGQIDHINGVRDDNRIKNLRDVAHHDNQRNMKRSVRNKSGVVGVHFNKRLNKWQATIRENGKSKYLGIFETIDDAKLARLHAEEKIGFHPNHGRG